MPGGSAAPSRPTHPVELICCAIATQEGYFHAGTKPAVLNNPGDLRYAGQVNAHPSVATDPQSIAKFGTKPQGIAALYRQVWLQVALGQTLRQLIAQWAPPNENNTSLYLQDVAAWTGLDTDVPILAMLPDLQRLA